MADNIDEEDVINSTNTQFENPSGEIIPAIDTETIIQNQATENMEVHKHPHHVTHKKKWGEYLLEFLMLFLAVFLGFTAENIRENSADRKKEKEYIHSMINDLKADTLKLSEIIPYYEKSILMQDTLLMTYSSLNNGFKWKFFKNLFGTSGYLDFIYTDATIQQLKNSGGFRILRNRKDIDSIMVYDEIVKKALISEANLNRSFLMLNDFNNEIFNFQSLYELGHQRKSVEEIETEKFDILLTHNKNTLSRYYNQLFSTRLMYSTTMRDMKRVKIGAIRLISYLQREYDIQ